VTRACRAAFQRASSPGARHHARLPLSRRSRDRSSRPLRARSNATTSGPSWSAARNSRVDRLFDSRLSRHPAGRPHYRGRRVAVLHPAGSLAPVADVVQAASYRAS
jgi:hypothetical protein